MKENSQNKHYQRLVQDHINISYVFQVLKTEVQLCQKDAWRDPNLALLLDGLDYIHDYSEQFHHPLEERIFDYMSDKKLLTPDILDSVREQHCALEQRTNWLRTELLSMISNQGASDHFSEEFTQYLWYQADHIDLENVKVFPIIAGFTQADWDKVESLDTHSTDPISDIDESQERQYATLLNQIHRDCAAVS